MKYLYFVTFVHLFMFTSSQAILDYLRRTTIKAFFCISMMISTKIWKSYNYRCIILLYVHPSNIVVTDSATLPVDQRTRAELLLFIDQDKNRQGRAGKTKVGWFYS